MRQSQFSAEIDTPMQWRALGPTENTPDHVPG
jgi:hypothetical protein